MSAADARGPWEAQPCDLTSGYSVVAPKDEHGARTVVASYVPAECAAMVEQAPEMTAVLRALCKIAEDGDVASWASEWDAARAVLAKATRRLP